MPHVDDLILLGAPSCCGKTYFLKQLFDGRLNDLLTLMNIDSPIKSHVLVEPKDVSAFAGSRVPHMILHFTIPSIPLIEKRQRQIEDDLRLEFVRHSGRVTAITLIADRNVLSSRLQARSKWSRKLLFKSVSKYLSVNRKLGKLKRIYSSPEDLIAVYDAWFSYLRSLPNLDNSWLITTDECYDVFKETEWQQIKGKYYPLPSLPEITS
jgi:hypothetical protein